MAKSQSSSECEDALVGALVDQLLSVDEAAAVADLLNRTYYHGCAREKDALDIIERGVEPLSLRDIGYQPRRWSAPVAGRVYITPNLKEAVIYVLGGIVMGEQEGADRLIKEYGQWGYLFEFTPRSLGDVQPDEDYVGAALRRALTGEVYEGMKFYEWIVPLAKRWLSAHALYQVEHGGSHWEYRAGKTLLKHMTDGQSLEMLRDGAAMSVEGILRPARAWRFDRGRAGELKPDASNFFELAEKVALKAA